MRLDSDTRLCGALLSVFRRADLSPVGDVALDGIPVRVVTMPGGEVAVALSDAGEVAIVDVAGLRVKKSVPVAARPDGICLSPGGDYAAVASNAEGRVDIFQLPAWKPIAALEAGDGSGSCLLDGEPHRELTPHPRLATIPRSQWQGARDGRGDLPTRGPVFPLQE